MRRHALPLSLLLVLTLGASAFACPMCKDSVNNDDSTTNVSAAAGPGGATGGPSAGLPGGFNTSIYLMFLGLFGAMGLVGWTVVKGMRGPAPHVSGFPVVRRPAAGTPAAAPTPVTAKRS